MTVINNLPDIGSDPSDFNPNAFTNISISLGAVGYDLYVNGVLKTSSIAYRTGGVSDIELLSFTGSGSGGSTGAGAWVDNITVVPESGSTLAMLGLVIAGLTGVRRRRA